MITNDAPERPVRQAIATVLGWITTVCTIGWWLAFAVTSYLLKQSGPDGPPFYPGIVAVVALILTLPLAFLCTIIALLLVGADGSKLAWISLFAYVVPLFGGYIITALLHY